MGVLRSDLVVSSAFTNRFAHTLGPAKGTEAATLHVGALAHKTTVVLDACSTD